MKDQANNPPFALLVLDGFGLAPEGKGNAITRATAPHIFDYMDHYASSELKAHGEHVGLFKDQAGNSEAGHFNIGAGRVVKQDLVMISEAIEDGTFFKNPAFDHAAEHANKHKGKIHLVGLLTDGHSAHAYPDHVYALMRYFRERKVDHVYLHLFTDGRDASPHSAVSFLSKLRKEMRNGERIATIGGRFYGMDRAKLWDRTRVAYDAMVLGKGREAASAEEAVTFAYNCGETDEYIEPTVIMENGKPVATIDDHDIIIMFNARSDRARQLAKSFVQEDFKKRNPGAFTREKFPKDLSVIAMTDFGPDLPSVYTAFPTPDVDNALAKAIGESRRQLYISETEKYAHVTFFMNGGFPQPINGEVRELVPSTGHRSYADKPDMSAKQVTDTILRYLRNKQFDFVVANFPNADMVGHTGDIEATKKAVRHLDMQVHRIVSFVLKHQGTVMITADHGNAEDMYDEDGETLFTEHTTNPVPCIVISKQTQGKTMKNGKLADVAPTILKLLDLKKPAEMTGRSLL